MQPLWISVLQFLSILAMWCLCLGMMVLVPWLVYVAASWQDALNWSFGISIIMTPVYLTVGVTLTYVYVGLRRGRSATKSRPPAPRER